MAPPLFHISMIVFVALSSPVLASTQKSDHHLLLLLTGESAGLGKSCSATILKLDARSGCRVVTNAHCLESFRPSQSFLADVKNENVVKTLATLNEEFSERREMEPTSTLHLDPTRDLAELSLPTKFKAICRALLPVTPPAPLILDQNSKTILHAKGLHVGVFRDASPLTTPDHLPSALSVVRGGDVNLPLLLKATNVRMSFGLSGGALTNAQDQLIGINKAFVPFQDIGFAIPLVDVIAFLKASPVTLIANATPLHNTTLSASENAQKNGGDNTGGNGGENAGTNGGENAGTNGGENAGTNGGEPEPFPTDVELNSIFKSLAPGEPVRGAHSYKAVSKFMPTFDGQFNQAVDARFPNYQQSTFLREPEEGLVLARVNEFSFPAGRLLAIGGHRIDGRDDVRRWLGSSNDLLFFGSKAWQNAQPGLFARLAGTFSSTDFKMSRVKRLELTNVRPVIWSEIAYADPQRRIRLRLLAPDRLSIKIENSSARLWTTELQSQTRQNRVLSASSETAVARMIDGGQRAVVEFAGSNLRLGCENRNYTKLICQGVDESQAGFEIKHELSLSVDASSRTLSYRHSRLTMPKKNPDLDPRQPRPARIDYEFAELESAP